ncbi:hypothetical protein [Pedobacter nyackensis]|uniref:beta strand repeat-containing protein n=1 Tax=Pedobacter nyackensis TaxID=475255 RepID=UPI00292D8543|nr:hypothetical protein [Pedobacter nyackensis]
MKQLFLIVFALLIINTAYGQVKATSSEINTGTDDDKFATALALQGSKYLDQNGGKISAVTAAGANTYTASINPAITAYSMGQVFYIKITTANTGASTLNLNGLGAKTLVKDASAALVSGDLLANKVYAVYYDGTNFQVLNASITGGNYVLKSGDTMTGNLNGVNGIFSAGLVGNRLGVGVGTDPSIGVNHTATIQGGTNALGYRMSTNIGSDVTTGGYGFRTNLGTVPSSTTLPTLIHFSAYQLPIGAGSSVTTQTGFEVSSNLIGAGTNRGFSSFIPSGTNNHNIYMGGTAQNYMAGNLGLGVQVPTEKLDVVGSVKITNSVANKLKLQQSAVSQSNFIDFINETGISIGYVGKLINASNTMSIGSATGDVALSAAGTTRLTVSPTVLASTIPYYGTAGTFSGNVQGSIFISAGTSGQDKGFVSRVGATNRWYLRTNSIAETGSNTGSNFDIVRYDDAGAAIATTLSINRATGNVTSSGTVTAPTFIGALTGNASTASSVPWSGVTGVPTFNLTSVTSGAGNNSTSNLIRVTAAGNLPTSGVGLSTYYTGGVGTIQAYDYVASTHRPIHIRGSEVLLSEGFVAINKTSSPVAALDVNGSIIATGTVTAPTFVGALTGNAATASAVAWPGVTGKPTNLAGYGITDAATQASVTTLDANAVHKTGNETIAGIKLFSTSVGIGTTNVHTYKLAVGGGIIAESVKVKPQGQWPDYVFEKDYPILPLNELEKFVSKNKHLPNVPNAAEVKKDGIDVGEMNAKLLQKIEELTLYIIDQQKNIIDQQKGMINQQKEIKDLKTNEQRLSMEIEKLSAEMNLLKNK